MATSTIGIGPVATHAATAGSDLSSAQYRAVKIVDGLLYLAADGDISWGILQDAPPLLAQASFTVAGFARAKIKGTVAENDDLYVSMDGRLESNGAGDPIARAAQSGTDDQVIPVFVSVMSAAGGSGGSPPMLEFATVTLTAHGFDLTAVPGERVPVAVYWNGAVFAVPSSEEEITHLAFAAVDANTLQVLTVAESHNETFDAVTNAGLGLGVAGFWDPGTNTHTGTPNAMRLFQVSHTSLTKITLFTDWSASGPGAQVINASRKEDGNDLGTGGDFAVDFNDLAWDNKTRVLNADTEITIDDPGRTSSFLLALSSSVEGTKRNLTWVLGGSMTLAAEDALPSSISSAESRIFELRYDNDTGILRHRRDPRHVEAVSLSALPAEYGLNVLGGSITLDAKRSLNYELTGALAATVTFYVTNLAYDEILALKFIGAGPNNPVFLQGAGEFQPRGQRPQHVNGDVTYRCQQFSLGIEIYGEEHVVWV